MSQSRILLDNHGNVNGVPLTLNVCSDAKSNRTIFTISYKVNEQRSNWPKISLISAIFVNIIALFTIKISIPAILIIVIVLSFLCFFWVTHSVQSESLLVIPTVGIQNSVKFVFGKEEQFVAWPQIDDIIINEVVSMNRVLYYLTVIIKTSTNSNPDAEEIKLLPLFKHTKPRLMMVEMVYNELHTILMNTQQNSRMASGDNVENTK